MYELRMWNAQCRPRKSEKYNNQDVAGSGRLQLTEFGGNKTEYDRVFAKNLNYGFSHDNVKKWGTFE